MHATGLYMHTAHIYAYSYMSSYGHKHTFSHICTYTKHQHIHVTWPHIPPLICTHKHPHMQVYKHCLHRTCACTYEKHIYTGVYHVTILHTHIHDMWSHPHIIAQAHIRTCIYTLCTCRCASHETTYTRCRECISTPSHKHVHI